jgi:aminoglycoside phosphotransferase (APT) family kinase protein
LQSFAADLGSFLASLHRIDPAGGPPATDRNWFRSSQSARDDQTRAAISSLDGVIDIGAAFVVWEAARRAPEVDSPTWIHGDVSASNLLVVDGRLSGVIDFGCCGIGDPAFDLEVAWDLFSGEGREIFRDQLELDDAAWARGRGWKLWAASRALVEGLETGADWVDWPRRVIDEVLSDHDRRPT